MLEISESAALLIAMSYQSFQRAEQERPELFFSNAALCMVTTAFYIEETLISIIGIKGWATKPNNTVAKFRGLLPMMIFFMNKFPTKFIDPPWTKSEEFNSKEALEFIDGTFPGFSQLLYFRNSICHGDLTGSRSQKPATILNIDKLSELRQNAKQIVNSLLEISEVEGKRTVSYQKASKVIAEYKGE